MEDVTSVFDQLAFPNKLTSNDTVLVTVPARRWDISLPADLYEEVARIYGNWLITTYNDNIICV